MSKAFKKANKIRKVANMAEMVINNRIVKNVDVLQILRLENPVTKNGMWYNEKGELDPFITKLTEGVSANLPMEPHERYGNLGRRWFSGCVSSDSIRGWFSTRDAQELFDNGYRLYRFESVEYSVEEHQVIFTREGIRAQEEIPLSTIFNLNN